MEKIEGDNFFVVKESMTEDGIAIIDTEIGKISQELSNIQNSEFGFLGEDTRYEI